MPKELNINVTYESQTFLMECLRHKFIDNLCKKIEIQPEEVEIYDSEKFCRKIEVKDFKSVMKVYIKKKSTMEDSNISRASLFHAQLLKKAEEGIPFNKKEKEYALSIFKRNRDFDMKDNAKKRHCGIQVDPYSLFSFKSSSSQTDEAIGVDLNSTKPIENCLSLSKKLAAQDKIDPKQARALMSKSFETRRNFILQECPMLSFVREQYPLLFNCAEIKNELDRIFYDGRCKEFIENIEKYAPHILSLAKDDDELLLTIKQKMKTYKTPKQKSYAQEVGSILMVSTILNERRDFLRVNDRKFRPSKFPYIKCHANESDLFFDEQLYSVVAEDRPVCEASDLKEALLCLMATYFIFNIQYSNLSNGTMVFFEKLYLQISDSEETAVNGHVQQAIKSVRLLSRQSRN